MKTFKRSIKGDKHNSNESMGKQTRKVNSAASPSTTHFYSPAKVVKALYNYQPQGPGELAFSKGDFFHVVAEEDEDWYEVSNPATNLRGMVPIVYFEVFGRSRPGQTSPKRQLPTTSTRAPMEDPASGLGTLYAKVMYDFNAERPEELDVSAGENLIICAHHEQDWFIAKPIGRLGGPGLVPVGFVQVNDLVNGAPDQSPVEVIIQKYRLPTVREWKEKNARYKASSIPLGDPLAKTVQLPQVSQTTLSEGVFVPLPAQTYVVDVSVESFGLHNDKYWYLVKPTMSSGRVRALCRYYENFFDFQIKLLDTFPDEAGKTVGVKRILPFIPGPLMTVNESISAQRCNDFDVYVKKLISLPTNVSRSELVVELFALRDGDREFGPDEPFELPNPTTRVHSQGSHGDNRVSDRNSHSQRSIGRTLTYQQDRLSQYIDVDRNSRISMLNSGTSPHNSYPSRNSHPGQSSLPPPLMKKVKIKVYFDDDIYALPVSPTASLATIKEEIKERLGVEDRDLAIYIKEQYDSDSNSGSVTEDDQLRTILLGDKVKLVALTLE